MAFKKRRSFKRQSSGFSRQRKSFRTRSRRAFSARTPTVRLQIVQQAPQPQVMMTPNGPVMPAPAPKRAPL